MNENKIFKNTFCSLVILFSLLFINFTLQVIGHSERYKGIYSGLLSQYDVVSPKVVFPNGDEINIYQKPNLRFKRHVADMKLRIRLPINGRNETIELWPNNYLLSNNIEIQIKRNESFYSYQKPNMCYYRGIVETQPESSVAVSICEGMIGFLKTKYGEYWIEPSKITDPSKDDRLHLLFRRSAVTQTFTKRKKKRKKKKENQLCGTKEPPRKIGSHIKWNQKPGWVKIQGRDRIKSQQYRNPQLSRKTRRNRSISKEHYVEALVVADHSMVEFYRNIDIEMYILSIMNMVNVMYQDPSIGNYINVVVVKIILLEDDKVQGLKITHNADDTLSSFCEWQKSLNTPNDDDPQHHDVAILITRKDICSGADKPCSTLGVANVAGMCSQDKSCSINEDNGITLAHTIAHELGHNFGMFHDSKKLGCSSRKGATIRVMTPSFEADTIRTGWSSCSRNDITHFLDGGNGRCLENKPFIEAPLIYPELPFGVIYNADYQCRLQFSTNNSSVCVPQDEICSRLWCLVDGVCTTMLYPAAPGTNCGHHKWCEKQRCVGMENKLEGPVDGGWGKWSEWSECSRSCGAGVSITERSCEHPPPSRGGKYCTGQRVRYRICNTQECLNQSVSFRAEQCLLYNNTSTIANIKTTWLPYFETSEPCQLYCTDKEDTTIMPMGVPVKDGTPCNLGSRDMCISGLCRKVGCDWVVDSKAVEDKCGVCKGNGSQCKTVTGYYNKTYGLGYTEVLFVPRNARNVLVEELGNSKNYLGVRSSSNNYFYLNGNKIITLPGEYEIAESDALYSRQKEQEKIHILGPIQEDINVYLIYQENYKNTGIRYEYTMPLLNEVEKGEYEWSLSDWSTCSVTCGGGIQYLMSVCKNINKLTIVESSFCSHRIKPTKYMRDCNLQPCAHRWWTGPWQLCPVTCGDFALRSRTVLCVSNDDHQIALPDSECSDHPKPHQKEPCIKIPSCFPSRDYFTNSQTHYINNRIVKNTNNFTANMKTKSKWTILPWSQCSVTCGFGFKKRTIVCSKNETCNFQYKPTEIKQCLKKC